MTQEQTLDRKQFFEQAVKCPLCKNVYTLTKKDYLDHLEYCRNRKNKNRLEWRKSQHNNNVSILWHEKDPVLTRNIKQQGKVQTPQYTYTLSENGKWIKRTIRK